LTYGDVQRYSKLPQWGRAKARWKTNLVHSKAVRKPLVAIVLNIVSTMFYSRTIKNLALANMTVSGGVESVAQSGGEGRADSAPSKSVTATCKYKTSSHIIQQK